MKHTRYAKRYARMFLSSVGAANAEQSMKELAIASALVDKSADFRRLMSSPMFTVAERGQALKALAPSLGFSEATVKFLMFLSAERAGEAVTEVLNKAVAIFAERMNRVAASVVTPAALSKDQEERVKAALMKVTGKTVDLTFATDPALIGGVLVKVGSTMFDGSIRGQLRTLRNELTKV